MSQNKIGVLVESLEFSQACFCMVTNLNNWDADCYLFYENPSLSPIEIKVPVMQSNELFLFNGSVVATNINTASKLLQMPTAARKFFYLWDLEWLRPKFKIYHDFAKIYRHPDITLICRNQDHATMVETCFNRHVRVSHIAEDFDIFNIL